MGGENVTDDRGEWLAERFEQHRARLRDVAHRMLGSATEADDAVQETWVRLSRSDTSRVDNLGAWLTTVLSRVCLTVLQQRRSRRETVIEEVAETPLADTDPEQEALIADSVGIALLVVIDTLAPAERVAFVLHDVFAVPFEEIAPIVDRSEQATRQLASRARRRVRLQGKVASRAPGELHAELVASFLAAAREGDFSRLLALLDTDARLRADETAIRLGAAAETRGATEIATTLSGWGHGLQAALIDGVAGAAWAAGGHVRVALRFTSDGTRITTISLIGDVDELRRLELEIAAR